jgi:hypothetical protein
MSGPVAVNDLPSPTTPVDEVETSCVEITEDREAMVGHMKVRRALPRRGRRTVGAWCFADHMGPAEVTEESGLDIGPHPHIGLQTVTWLIDGQVLHRDSLGSEQVIRPGQLNLMTAGHGVAHSEEATGHYRGKLQGIQLWIAQPEGTRHGAAAFEHHVDLPQIATPGADVTVLVGSFTADATSPARHDTALVGVDVVFHGGASNLPLRNDFEYALVVLAGGLTVDQRNVTPGHLAYLGRGRDELGLHAEGATRALLIGGEPFDEPLVMWWNFVARSRDEMAKAYDDWQNETSRFSYFPSPIVRIPAPSPYWLRAGS